MDTETIKRARRKYLFNEDDNILYDDEEQEEIINALSEKNDKNNEIYSIAISIAFVILNLFFNFEIISKHFSFLSVFIILLSWLVVCCITTSFRQYTTHKYYVRIGDNDKDDDNYNSEEISTAKKPHFKKKYLEYFNILGKKMDFKRFDITNDEEVPNSPYFDIKNYISLGLSLLIIGLTIGFQNWWHINKLIPFVPLIMASVNLYASVIIDETTTEINSLKGYKSPYKGA
ncbi:hypothetical protein BCR36DRAFT_405437 [Piromyces finnis]|uniref:Uncharacterized protein n=1 Tax=Piromyces finnis TaxID=1754191 RepID=A0A1Y1V4G0_9FUNG|nr:hypothetical protein BCR36DRAFT_405437 [Piromyces finnis]|eukprot:ORX47082.1 hypothetical protein BCR36DRAFT_405437 [Piromyces finnis]